MRRDAPDWLAALLARGADVDSLSCGLTPLMMASLHHRPRSARVLLEHGADRTITSTSGKYDGKIAADLAGEEIAALLGRWTAQMTRRSKKQREEATKAACVRAMHSARTASQLRTAIECAVEAGVGRAAMRQSEARLREQEANEQDASWWHKVFLSAPTATDLKDALVRAAQVWARIPFLPTCPLRPACCRLPVQVDRGLIRRVTTRGHIKRLQTLLIQDLDDADSEEALQSAIDAVQGGCAGAWPVLPDPSRPTSQVYLFTVMGQNPDHFLAIVNKDGMLTSALDRAKARLVELQTELRHKTERVVVGVDHLMPERPTEHLCTITLQPMHDPVVAADGFTYERQAVACWLRTHGTSRRHARCSALTTSARTQISRVSSATGSRRCVRRILPHPKNPLSPELDGA